VQVYQKLLDAGLQPISTTYTALISAFGKAGQLDKALDTFQTMIQQGCERSVITYSALISACEKAGKWEVALDLFDQMQHEGCRPNTVTYNSLITACQQGGPLRRWGTPATAAQSSQTDSCWIVSGSRWALSMLLSDEQSPCNMWGP
jgi:pentatricopeptide repeat domain-containing protein 1